MARSSHLNGLEQFIKANNCKHTRTSPYHPATNGLAERFVQPLKQALRASHKEVKSLHHRIACFLLHYRNARHSTTEVSPAQLLMKRDLRSVLHLMRPDVRDNVFKNQSAQVNSWAAAVERNFGVGDSVMVRDNRPKLATSSRACQRRTQVLSSNTAWRRGPMEATFRPDGACL